MHIMTPLEGKIVTVSRETQNSADVIIRGSDEHLDILLAIINPMKDVTCKMEVLNEMLWSKINDYSKKQLEKDLLPKLIDLKKAVLVFGAAVVTSKFYPDVNATFNAFKEQHDLLHEIISDIKNLMLAEDEEFDKLLNDLNKL